MGSGLEMGLAPGLSDPNLVRAIDNMKDQLLITLVEKLAGLNKELVLSVAEIDGTGDRMMVIETRADQRSFAFKVTRKQ